MSIKITIKEPGALPILNEKALGKLSESTGVTIEILNLDKKMLSRTTLISVDGDEQQMSKFMKVMKELDKVVDYTVDEKIETTKEISN